MKSIVKVLITSVIATSMLAGCAAFHVAKMTKAVTQKVVSEKQQLSRTGGLITATPDAYLAGTEVRTPRQYPSVLRQHFEYLSRIEVPLSQVAAIIEEQDGVVVDTSGLQQTNILSSLKHVSAPNVVSLFYSGPLYMALNEVAAQTQSWWKFSDGEVRFYRTVTKTFQLAGLPETCKVNSSLTTKNAASQISAGASSSSSAQNNSSGIQANCIYAVNAWNGVQGELSALASSATVLVNQSVGAVTVTGSPDVVRRVSEIVKQWNKVSDEQVVITMHVYNVQLEREDNYGISPNLTFQSILGTNGWSVTGVPFPTAVTATPAELGASLLSSATHKTGFSGSNVTAQALSTFGHVVDVYQNSEITQNGEPAVFTNTHTVGYTYEVSATATANVGTSSSIQPGSFTSGFISVATPRIEGGLIHLGISLYNKDLKSLNDDSSGGETIQTPDYTMLATFQNVVLKPGQSLLLTGYEGNAGNSTLNGFVGAGEEAETNKTMVAIVVEAKVL